MKILAILFSLFFPIVAHAQTITPIASPSSAASSEEVQKIREVVQQKVKEKLQQITTTTTTPDTTVPKSIIGTITLIEAKDITLNYKDNNNIVTIADSTAFYDIKKNKISYSAIKIGQDVLALGYHNAQNGFDVKRFIAIDLKTTQNTNQVVVGKIVDISKSNPIIVVIPSKNNSTQFQIKLDAKTEIVDQNNKKYTQSSLSSGQKIITIIKPDIKMANTYYASKIIISNPTSLTPSPIASPSAAKKR
jgi:hypothetical protein